MPKHQVVVGARLCVTMPPRQDAKRQRLEHLVGAKHITHAAMAALLKDVVSAPMEAASRWVLGDVVKRR